AQLFARRDHHIRKGASATLAAAAVRHRSIPARGDARRHLRAREIAAQPLARLKLHALNQRLAIPPFTPHEPGERAFRLIHGHVHMAVRRRNQPAREAQETGAERIDVGLRCGLTNGLRELAIGFAHDTAPRVAPRSRRSACSRSASAVSSCRSSRRSSMTRHARAAVVRTRPNALPASAKFRSNATWARYIAL